MVKTVDDGRGDETAARTFIRLGRWAEIVGVVLMALAALLTAWSGYESARWGGVQSTKYSEASARRSDSARAAARANQLTAIDVTVFGDFLSAYAAGQQDLATAYEKRFRAEFQPAFKAWIATSPTTNPNAPSSPFVMSEYHLADREQADQLEAEATKLFSEGKKANQRSDDYVLTTVILASVLFFAGISTRIVWQPASFGVIALGCVMFLYGAVRLATMPVQ